MNLVVKKTDSMNHGLPPEPLDAADSVDRPYSFVDPTRLTPVRHQCFKDRVFAQPYFLHTYHRHSDLICY